MRIGINVVLLAALLYCSISCLRTTPHQFVLADFESEGDLDSIYWKCYTLFSLSVKNVTHGTKALRIELYPSDYPGLSFKLAKNDWTMYKTLSFDIYNPTTEIPLKVRIDDRLNHPNYDDRYNNTFYLKHGSNPITIQLKDLVTSGTDRMLDLENIYRFLIFMSHPQEKTVLYIDYVHLE